jgi:hypothetical protein
MAGKVTQAHYPSMSTDAASKAKAGKRVLQIMRFLNLKNKRAFAEWAGRSQAAVSDWFSGETPLQLDIALRLKSEKKISLDWIYAGDDSGQSPTVTEHLEKSSADVVQMAHPSETKDRRRARRRA